MDNFIFLQHIYYAGQIFDYWFEKVFITIILYLVIKLCNVGIETIRFIQAEQLKE